ncbi:MAG: TauD/TfdA family dioxygenase [Chromatiales bacterium]|nr:TauD/TfdA family dioxygenase [Chromatiales bacterium]
MNFNVEPIDATLGACVTGLDLSALDDTVFEALYQTFLEHGVLVFPAQHLSDDAQEQFARRFGDIERTSPNQTRGVSQISNQKPDGSVLSKDEFRYKVLRGNEGWHTDSTYMPLASKVAMLSALVVPPEGGETGFADMRAAWDALDPATQEQLEGMSAHHSLYYSQAQAAYTFNTDNQYGLHDKGAPLRPMVKTHPETGRKSLYTGRHAYGIPGLSAEESERLLSETLENACQAPRTYVHKWQVGDLVVWDNRCVMHRACPYDTRKARVLRGSRIAGDPASELAPTSADERANAFHPSTSNVTKVMDEIDAQDG